MVVINTQVRQFSSVVEQLSCKQQVTGSNPVTGSDISPMKVNLWYCQDMNQWRWSLVDDKEPMRQESGQQPFLRDAMNDVANTVEYLLETNQKE
jgi:hypothetical protein